MLEVLCQVVEDIIDTRIKSLMKFHYVLHGFCANKGMGTEIMDINMAQELARINQDPIFLVFLDSSEAYDTPDHGIILHTLEGYRAVLKMLGIMEEFL